MRLRQRIARFRNRGVWQDPVRRVRTLESFAETEEDGGKDLLVAARRILDADLRHHVEKHAADEVRHAQLFRDRATELRAGAELQSTRASESDSSYDLSRGRKGDDVNAHGFFSASMCDDLGELAYVAMLHVAEQRARDLFEVHHSLNAHDPATAAVFHDILRDENYHVAYTGKFLDRWREQGRGGEVRVALKDARGSRFVGSWKRLGIRSGASFSRAVLYVLYWTVLAPFGLIARYGRRRPAVELRVPDIDLKRQY